MGELKLRPYSVIGYCRCMHKRTAEELLEHIARTVVETPGPLDTPCEVWPLGQLTGGYGGVKYEGKDYRVHRVRWELTYGSVSSGMHLDHLCRVRLCAALDHLEPVTPRENILRGEGLAAQQVLRTHCPSGHPYSGDNLYVLPSRPTARYCKACNRQQKRDRRARAKAAQQQDD